MSAAFLFAALALLVAIALPVLRAKREGRCRSDQCAAIAYRIGNVRPKMVTGPGGIMSEPLHAWAAAVRGLPGVPMYGARS